ncbi:scyllo-inositol 2-dehydrogenase (NAD(+)) [Siminovitchia terrae]|uniref:Scyllo-inositol 2-dehydrogenase (NAD(+)) n=1 Tax=Siminovitchia terrae TaxID=1914933 RepID=A0ABQ4L438_SIMTE|nr:inositol 2-dehydrogenase [Siminovitchia terrae]GIN91725.1 scyllo-inositol 2-dehydrogenase (NAD(+)) [Siminovitchia terrae]GIN98347.1 scyllo-inositol 2-dehydrogenase (NAD(+)) [Siminovitchia terrae]
MGENIKCAVIGVGRLGIIHATNLARYIPGVEVDTIVASRVESAEKTARELNVANFTNNLKEVLESDTIEAVVIATPTNTHVDIIIEAAKHDKHIFVDKPITETSEEAEKVIEVLNNHDIICQVGFMRRFDPSYIEAKRRIQQGDIGEPIYFKGLSRDPGSPPESYIKTSGGIFLDLCIHEFDISRFLIGSDVSSVQSFGKVHVHPFMEKYGDVDQSMSYLEFENGATADIEGSRNSSFGYDVRGEVLGTEGMIQIGSNQHHKNIILTKNKSYFDTIPDFPTNFKDSFLNEMEHFIECIRQNEKPSVDALDGLIAIQISEAATKSYKTKQKVYVN